MSEFDKTPRPNAAALWGTLAFAILCGAGSLVWNYSLSSKIANQQAELEDAKQQNKRLASELRETNAHLKVDTEELGKSLGLTQKQLDTKAEELIRRENATEENNQRLAAAQKQTAQQVNAVSSEVSNVKSDVGGVKNEVGGVRSDVAKTRGELATAIGQLQSMRGDLDSHGSLIARNHDELELLKHKGDRNYYEFVINKGQKKPVGTISIELKKTDAKKNKLTLDIYSDDNKYEKKDRNTNEPLQIYVGKDKMLFEVVVNSINSKNQITGYVSAPKNAPVPPSVP